MTPDCTAPVGLITDVIDNNCFGQSLGSDTIIGSGSNPPFTYSFNGTIDADGILTNLPAGNYTVLVIDDVNCSIGVDFTIEERIEEHITHAHIRKRFMHESWP